MTNRCPSCRKVRIPRPREIGVGEPFVKCRKCGTIFVWSRRNEWGLMTAAEQSKYIREMLMCPLWWGAASVAILCAVDWWRFGALHYLRQPLLVLSVVGGSIVLCRLVIVAKMRRDIRRSARRLADPQYRDQLHKLGILKDAE